MARCEEKLQAAKMPYYQYGAHTSEKKGENYELRSQLNSQYSRKRKDAVKKVIANMAHGNDVSGLFADVIKNMQTDDLELKKLVYLYLATNARTKPTLVVLAVNTFVKDAQSPDPLIRALAIRTIGILRVEKISMYLIDTLKKSVIDTHPYVRKTAALCIAKIILFQPGGVVPDGLVSCLKDMLNDKSPAVVANAASALLEVSSLEEYKDSLSVNDKVLKNLLKSLTGASEWCQIVIIKALESYKPTTCTKAAELCESVLPRIQHNNPGVGLATVRLLLGMIKYLGDDVKLKKTIYGRIAKFLVTAMNSSPEIQFVILKNMGLILQLHPEIKISSVQSFFVSYRDPLYLKFEKLNILVSIADEANVSVLINEFQEYRREVELEFVKKTIQAIGQISLKIPSAAEECVSILIEIAFSDQEAPAQESVAVLKNVYRKYGRKFSKFIPKIFEGIGTLDRNDAIASVLWFIGEYYSIVPQSYKLLSEIASCSADLDSTVFLQLLHTLAKLNMTGDVKIKALFEEIIDTSINKTMDPDIRTRAHIYSQLLKENADLRESVILSKRPEFQIDTYVLPKNVLSDLLKDIGSLFALNWDRIGYEPVVKSNDRERLGGYISNQSEEEDDIREIVEKAVHVVDSTAIDDIFGVEGSSALDASDQRENVVPKAEIFEHDYRIIDIASPYVARNESYSFSQDNRSSGVLAGSNNSISPSAAKPIRQHSWDISGFVTLLKESETGGLEISARLTKTKMHLFIANHSDQQMEDFGIQFNVNSLGLVPESDIDISEPLDPGMCVLTYVLVSMSDDAHTEEGPKLQVAFKNNFGIYFSVIDLPE